MACNYCMPCHDCMPRHFLYFVMFIFESHEMKLQSEAICLNPLGESQKEKTVRLRAIILILSNQERSYLIFCNGSGLFLDIVLVSSSSFLQHFLLDIKMIIKTKGLNFYFYDLAYIPTQMGRGGRQKTLKQCMHIISWVRNICGDVQMSSFTLERG